MFVFFIYSPKFIGNASMQLCIPSHLPRQAVSPGSITALIAVELHVKLLAGNPWGRGQNYTCLIKKNLQTSFQPGILQEEYTYIGIDPFFFCCCYFYFNFDYQINIEKLAEKVILIEKRENTK